MAKDMSDIIIEHPEWNEPIKSVKQVLAEILRKYDCLMMPVKEEQLRKEILDFLTDGYSTHDQQVRKAVIKEAIAFLEEHRLTLEWRAHLRAMAGGER
jgi:predicted transcriptional regulator